MKSFSQILANHMATLPKSRPLEEQQKALEDSIAKNTRKLKKRIECKSRAMSVADNEAAIAKLQSILTKQSHQLVNIIEAIKNPHKFNRNGDSKPRVRNQTDKGKWYKRGDDNLLHLA